MGYTSDLITGLAQELANTGVGVFHDATYAATDTGIGLGQLPDSCDRAVAITDYGAIDDYPDQIISTQAVQFWFRGGVESKTDVNDLRDAVFAVIHGITYRQFGSVYVNQILRVSSVPQGMDDRRRWEISDNYYADVLTPASAYRS